VQRTNDHGVSTCAQPPDSRRVLLLTSNVGEGHAAAARALKADLGAECAGIEIETVDAFAIFGSVLRFFMLDVYRWQLRRAPWLFGAVYRSGSRSRLLQSLGRAGLVLFGRRRMLRLLRSHRPHAVVSTYPAATMLLGHLRGRGVLDVPAYATITDLGGLEFWSHPGIDLHLVMDDRCVTTVEQLTGPGSARSVRPVVGARFFEPRSRAEARRALDLPDDVPIVVVSGGGWGVGDIEGAVQTVLEVTNAVAVCLTGRNPALEAQLASVFAAEGRVRVCGFVEEMSDLLAAADVLVHSTGGVTVLEATVRGCPVVAYGAPAGHLGTVTREMVALGAVEHATSAAELLGLLTRLIENPPGRAAALDPLPTAASVVLSSHERTRRRPRRLEALAFLSRL
jgi:processive 1,2-diacylglycerol beta-glucosyltransferase